MNTAWHPSCDGPPPMTARTATRRLYVTLAQLATLVVSLLCAILRLLLALATWAARSVERRAAGAARPGTVSRASAPVPPQNKSFAAPAPAAAPVVASSPRDAAAFALVNLGYPKKVVDGWRVKLGTDAERAEVAELVKDGLRSLAS